MVTCSTNALCLDKVAHGKTIKEVGLTCDHLFFFKCQQPWHFLCWLPRVLSLKAQVLIEEWLSCQDPQAAGLSRTLPSHSKMDLLGVRPSVLAILGHNEWLPCTAGGQ